MATRTPTQPTSPRIRTALIGLGRIGFDLEHDRLRYHPCTHAGTLRAWNDALRPGARRKSAFDLIAVCDRDERRIQRFQRWWAAGRKKSAPTAFTDYRQLLREKPDLLIIATSVESHALIALAAVRAGVPALLLEKPIAHELAAARRLLRAARAHGTRVWVNFERRYHPAYRLAREYIQKKKLGELRHISGQVLRGRMRPDPLKTIPYPEGPLLHDAVHWMDLLVWMAGSPRTLDAKLDLSAEYPDTIEDSARLSMEYEHFAACLESGGRRRYFEFTMRLDFTEGRIIAGNAGHFYFRAGPSRRYAKFRELRPITVRWKTANPWLELYGEINRELTGVPRLTPGDAHAARARITASLEDAVRGLEIIHRAYRQFKDKARKNKPRKNEPQKPRKR